MIGVTGDLQPVIDRITAVSGFRCDAYKETCLRRRLAVRMRAVGVHTYDGYAQVLDSDAAELEKFLAVLTVNVTSFYRNPETFDLLRHDVLPVLRAEQWGGLDTWSAGCASGQEAYSLAMLLRESDDKVGSSPSTVYATDIDAASLATARQGRYDAKSFETLPAALRSAGVVTGAGDWEVNPETRAMVRFSESDLLRDAPPVNHLQLVLCRNVVIYFDRDAQQQLFHRIADALTPGGFLVLGKTETLLGEVRERFQLYDIKERGVPTHMSAFENIVSVRLGEYAVTRGEGKLAALGLGSCVAVLLYDADAHVGGIAHIVLPGAEYSTDQSNPVKFADSGVTFLIDEMERAGGDRERFEARLVGGASMFSNLFPQNTETMGQRNLFACRVHLHEAGIPIVSEEVGAHHGRSVVLDVGSGEVTVRSVGEGERRL